MSTTVLIAALLLSQAKGDAPAVSNPEAPPPSVGPSRRAAPPEVFRSGLEAFYDEDYADAAARMFDYVSTNEDTVENRAWAKYFLAVSLEKLGFTHGAAEHLFDVAQDRTRPELIPDALEAVERVMQGPHDEALLDRRLLTDNDFGYLPPDLAGFVRYHQGLSDLRAGRRRWALRLFEAIPQRSAYAAKARYARGVAQLKREQESEAVGHFRAALAHPAAQREVRNLARLALARVLYEREAFEAAHQLYAAVEVPALTAAEGEVLLERAWTAYRRRRYRESMGLLHALDAPSYRTLHAPEKFLLRALIFKRLCHYIPAKREVRRFRFAFEPTLEHIRRRADLRESAALRRAALQLDPALGRLLAFREVVADELDRVDEVSGSWRETGLDDDLRDLYDLAAARSDLQLDAGFSAATRAAAEELIAFEEQMSLLDYEIGLAIYERLRGERARREEDRPVDVPLVSSEAIYPFVDEYWNDELDRYDFLIENRCFGAED